MTGTNLDDIHKDNPQTENANELQSVTENDKMA